MLYKRKWKSDSTKQHEAEVDKIFYHFKLLFTRGINISKNVLTHFFHSDLSTNIVVRNPYITRIFQTILKVIRCVCRPYSVHCRGPGKQSLHTPLTTNHFSGKPGLPDFDFHGASVRFQGEAGNTRTVSNRIKLRIFRCKRTF